MLRHEMRPGHANITFLLLAFELVYIYIYISSGKIDRTLIQET